jgi:hypothetical protein
MDGIHETSINLFMNLTPPGAIGEGFGNLAVDLKGVPIGETPSGKAIATLLGYSDTDTIGPALDDIVKMAANLNIGIMISGNGSIDHTINVYLNTIDPTKPGLPPIKALLVLLERDLAAGKIGDVQINVVKDGKSKDISSVNKHINTRANYGKAPEIDKTKDAKFSYESTTKDDIPPPVMGDGLDVDMDVIKAMANNTKDNLDIGRDVTARADGTRATVSVGQGVGGNPWLSGNAYVTFLMVFMEMQRMLMQNKVVQGNIELAGMNMTVELAKARADLIMEIAKQNQMIHIVTAVMSAVSIGISVFGLVGAGKAASKTTPDAAGKWSPFSKTGGLTMESWTTVGQMGAAFEKLATSITQAATDINIAAKEGRKEVLQAYGALVQRIMEKAGEAFKSQEDMIQQLIQTLDKIRDNLQQAIAGSLRK